MSDLKLLWNNCFVKLVSFQVHWRGYDWKERTWEPEENLENCEELQKFKERNNMSLDHLTFEHHYEHSTWRRISLASEKCVTNRYLKTDDEIEEKRARKKAKLEEQNRKEQAKNPHASAETEPAVKKKKIEGVGSRIPKISDREGAGTSGQSSSNVSTPGITPLDNKTPRMQKKSNEIGQASTPECAIATLSIGTPQPSIIDSTYDQSDIANGSTSPQPQPVFKRKMNGQDVSDYSVHQGGTFSDGSAIEGSTSRESEDMDCTQETKKALQKAIEVCTLQILDFKNFTKFQSAREECEEIEKTIKKYPLQVTSSRVVTGFSPALTLRKFRRCQSLEMLSDHFNNNAEMEIFGKNFENSVRLDADAKPVVIKIYPQEQELFLTKQRKMPSLEMEQLVYENLVKENANNIKIAMHNIRPDKNFAQLLECLSHAYSKDDNIRFETIFNEGFPPSDEYDCRRFQAIVFLIAYCKHRLWKADPKGMAIVEASDAVKEGEIREQQIICSDRHRKCAWLQVFLKLMPDRFKFLETSGQCYHGWEGGNEIKKENKVFIKHLFSDDGPFRDDVFFHCMKYGAECQKRLFLDFNKPIGIQEETVGDYSVDAMHLLAVQYGNIQRIPSYLSIGGLDINALATHLPTKRVMRLQHYLKVWIEAHKSETTATEDRKKYYRYLNDVIRLTSESLEIFLENEVTKMIFSRMGGRWKIRSKFSFPIKNI